MMGGGGMLLSVLPAHPNREMDAQQMGISMINFRCFFLVAWLPTQRHVCMMGFCYRQL